MDVSPNSLFYDQLFSYFRFIGLSPHGQASTKILTLMLIFWLFHSICAQSAYAISNAESLDDVIKHGSQLFQIFGLALKLIIHWTKQNEISSLVKKINKLVSKKTYTTAQRHFQKLDDYINQCFRFYFGVGCFAFLTTVIINPLVLLIYTYHVGREWNFATSFPYIWIENASHLIAWYSIFVWIAAWAVFAIIVCDLLILGLCVQSYAFYQCLIDDFMSFDTILGTGLPIRPQDEAKARRKLRRIVCQHVDVIETLQNISDVLGPLIIVQFITGLVDVTLNFYVTHLYSVHTVVLFLTSTYQLFIYCYGGSIVPTMSDKFSRAIYNTNWYNYPLWAQKDFLMIVTMATRTRYISVFAYKCDLVTFKNILNFGYSIYAFLAHVKNN